MSDEPAFEELLKMTARAGDLVDEKAVLTSRVAKLEAALRPFAKHAQFFAFHEDDEHFDCHPKDDNFEHVDSEITVGDLRRALRALEK